MAQDIGSVGYGVELSATDTGLLKTLQSVQKAMESLDKSVNSLATKMDKSFDSIGQSATKASSATSSSMKKVERAITPTIATLDRLQDKYAQVAKSSDQIGDATGNFDKIQKAYQSYVNQVESGFSSTEKMTAATARLNREMTRAQQENDKYKRAMDAVEKSVISAERTVGNLSSRMQSLGASQQPINELTQALQRYRAQMTDAAGDTVATARAKANFATAVDRAKREVQELNNALRRNQRELEGASRRSGNFSSSMGALTLATGGFLSVFSAIETLRIADQYTNISNRIRVVSGETEDAVEATRRLLDLSIESRTSLDSTVDLYSKLTRANSQYGRSQEEILRITDAVSRSIAMSGATAQGAQGAAIQFAQAISNNFQAAAQEINSINEQTPALSQAMADALSATGKYGDVAISDLKRLASEGKLAAADLLEGFLLTYGSVVEAHERAILTMSQGWVSFRDAFSIAIGEVGQATGIVQLIADTLQSAAKNATDLSSTLVGVATTLVSLATTGAIGAFIGLGTLLNPMAAAFVGLSASVSVFAGMMAKSATETALIREGMMDAGDSIQEMTRQQELATFALQAGTGSLVAITGAFSAYTVAVGLATKATNLFKAALAFLTPARAAIALVIGLMGAMYSARDAALTFGDTTARLKDWVMGTWAVISRGAIELGETISNAFSSVVPVVMSVVESIASFYGTMAGNIFSSVKWLGNNLIAIFLSTMDTVRIVTTAIKDFFKTSFEDVLSLGKAFWEDLKAIFSGDLSFSNFTSEVETQLQESIARVTSVGSDIESAVSERFSSDVIGDTLGNVSSTLSDLGLEISDAAFRYRFLQNEGEKALESLDDSTSNSLSNTKDFSKGSQRSIESLLGSYRELVAIQEQQAALQSGGVQAVLDLQALQKEEAAIRDIQKAIRELSSSELKKFVKQSGIVVKAGESVEDAMIRMTRETANFQDQLKEQEDANKNVTKGFEDLVKQYEEANAGLVAITVGTDAYNRAIADLEIARSVNEITEEFEKLNAVDQARQIAILSEALGLVGVTAENLPQKLTEAFKGIDQANRELERAMEIAELAEKEAQRFEDAFTSGMDEVAKAFKDGFTNVDSSFADFSSNLIDSFKKMLADLAYEAFLRPIVVGFQSDAKGFLSGKGTGGFANTIGAAKNVLSAGTKAYGMLGLGGVSKAGAALGGMPGGLSSAAITSAGQVAGGASTGILGSIGSGLSAAMPWIGGGLALDSLLGGGITKAISGLFKGSKTNPHLVVDTRANDTYGHGSVRQGAFGAVGFGQGTRRSNDLFGGIDKEREFLAAVAASDDLLASLARSPSELDAMAKAVQNVSIQGKDVEDIMWQLSKRTVAAVSALGGDFGEFVSSLEGDIEVIVARVQQASAAMAIMEDATIALNLQFDASANGALRAADNMAQLAGGADQLASLQESYYQSFFSDAERATNLQRQLGKSLAEMGMALPSTREGFRQLVEQQNQMTESGQKNYVQLLQLSGAFNQLQQLLESTGGAMANFAQQLEDAKNIVSGAEDDVRNAFQTFIDQAFDIELGLLEVAGNEMGALALQREREIQSIDASLRPMQERLWALQDEKVAQEQAREAAQNYASSLASVQSQLSSTLQSISQWVDAEQAAGGSPVDNLTNATKQFEEQLKKAQGGDRTALGNITQYADRLLQAGQGMFASGTGFQDIRDGIIKELEKLPEVLSSEEYIVTELSKALKEVVIQSQPSDMKLADQLTQRLNALNAKQLTESQVRQALQGKASDAEINRLIARVDANGDGILTKQELTNFRLANLSNSIGATLEPMFDMIDTSLDSVIDYSEFSKAFAGVASDEELRKIFQAIDVNGDGTISRLEALGQTSEGTEGNTDKLASEAQKQIRELNKLVSEMTNSTNQFVTLNSTMLSLKDAINALGVAQEEVARIERERVAAEKAAQAKLKAERAYQEERNSVRSRYESMISEASYIDPRTQSMAKMNNAEGVSGWHIDSQGRSTTFRNYQGSLNNLLKTVSSANLSGMSNKDFQKWVDSNRQDALKNGGDWTAYYFERVAERERAKQLVKQSESEVSRLQKEMEKALASVKMPKFAKGGAFTNSVVNTPTMFNMGLMGEAGPEAIIPLTRGPGGELGVTSYGGGDGISSILASSVVESNYDLQEEIKQLRKDLNERLDRNNEQNDETITIERYAYQQMLMKLSESNEYLDDVSKGSRLDRSKD